MTSLLARLPFAKFITLAMSETEVAACEMALAPWGPVRLAEHTEPILAGRIDEAVQQALLRTTRGRRGMRVAVALPDRAVFFSTRPVQGASTDLQPQTVLREALQASSARASDMVVDMIRAQPGKRRVASLAACDRKYLESLLAGIERAATQAELVEPAPCALLRAAMHDHPAARHRKVVLRVFLNEGRGLAVLAAEAVPLVWRGFILPRGDEASAILAVARSLEAVSKYCGLDTPCEAVVLHGRSDLEQLLGFDWLQEQLGTPAEWFEGPAHDLDSAARGMALRQQEPASTGFNLVRGSSPQRPLRQVMPWGQLALQGCLLLCMLVFLLYRTAELDHSYSMARARNAEGGTAGKPTEAQLLKEKADLELRLATLRRYDESKVVWTKYLRRLSAELPDNLFLQSFQGENELDSGRRHARPKKLFLLRGGAPLSSGALPQEIDVFLNSLRDYPHLVQHFPNIELSGLQHVESTSELAAKAYFTISCLPSASRPGTGGGN